MSADNGIYIAKFPTCWRVCYASAIENIQEHPPGSEERKNELKDYFGKSPIFHLEGQALNYAAELSKEYDYLEYGIRILEGVWDEFDPTYRPLVVPSVTTTTSGTQANLYSVRLVKPAVMQLWLGDIRIGNVQGKNVEGIEEIVRLANLAVSSLLGIEFKTTEL